MFAFAAGSRRSRGWIHWSTRAGLSSSLLGFKRPASWRSGCGSLAGGFAGLATLVWLITNWIGQTYFSPQALAYVFDLAIVLVLLERRLDGTGVSDRALLTRCFGPGLYALRFPVGVLGSRRAARLRALPGRRGCGQPPAHAVHGHRPGLRAHPLRLSAAVALRCPGRDHHLYLLPNLSWVQAHYGLFSGLNPVDNAQVQRAAAHRAWFYSHVGGMVSIITIFFGFAWCALLVRHGEATSLPLGPLAFSRSFALRQQLRRRRCASRLPVRFPLAGGAHRLGPATLCPRTGVSRAYRLPRS